LIRPGTLPKTTSGKIQRSLTRRLWLERGLDTLTARAD
jgi:acyl-coenzyme A synthetase/AMP-(fatty) acid ligase